VDSALDRPDRHVRQQIPNLAQYTRVSELLGENYEVRTVDLSSGQVDADIDVLMVIAPQNLTDGELYAIDQYLMRGGRVFVAAGNYQLAYDSMNGNLGLQATQGNLKAMLAFYGISVGDALVMDTQNEPFPATVQRNVGGAVVNEIQALDYPFFVDVRADGMDSENPVTNSLQAITLNWASPLTVDETLNADRTVTPLLSSTGDSWLTTDTNIQPNNRLYPEWGFPVGSEHASHLLAVAVQGSFESFFKGKQSPFETEPAAEDASAAAAATPSAATTGTLETSPASAQLIVVGSNEFLNDIVFSLSNSLSGERYLNSIQFVQNAVDWFTQDSALAEIRTRGTTARLLKPLSDQEQSFWEALNYVLALLALGALYLIWRMRKRSEQPMPLVLPAGATGPARPDSLPEQPVKS
jgi:ABC-2 type transport system permease protein